MRNFICPDCLGIMQLFDLYDCYCKQANMRLRIEHQLCLQCGNAAMQLINIGPPELDAFTGRTESMEITCSDSRADMNIKQATLLELVKNYYAGMIHSLCFELFGKPWVSGFDILLWEAVHSNSSEIELNSEEIQKLKALYENTQLWLVNPAEWTNCRDNPKDTFVSIKEWSWMYINKERLWIDDDDKHALTGIGDPSENTEFEK